MAKWLLTLLTATAFIALACGSSGPPPTPTPGPTATPELPTGDVLHQLEIKDFKHISLTIKVGESILWTNDESLNVLHTTTENPVERREVIWSSPNMQPGESFRHTFTEPGEFRYVCTLHPSSMRAVITVVEE